MKKGNESFYQKHYRGILFYFGTWSGPDGKEIYSIGISLTECKAQLRSKIKQLNHV